MPTKPPQIGGVPTPVGGKMDTRPATQKKHNAARKHTVRTKHRQPKVRTPKPPSYVGPPLSSPGDARKFWPGVGANIGVSGTAFEVVVVRRGQAAVNVDALVESVDFDDTNPVLTGTLRCRVPAYEPPEGFNIGTGDRIRLRVEDVDGKMKLWWEMKVITPDASYRDGTRSFALASDLHRLADSVAEFKYVSDKKKKPHGWLAHDVIQDVCKQYGVTCVLPRMKARIKGYGPKITSPLDVIAYCVKREQMEEGKRWVIAFEHGVLVLRARARTARLLELGPLLAQASYAESIKQEFATAVHMRSVVSTTTNAGVDKNGHKKASQKVVRAYVASAPGVRRYGLVTKMGYAYADSQDALEGKGRRHLAYVLNPDRTISIQHPGIPGVRRNDAVRVNVHADRDVFDRVLYVSEARWSIAAGRFDMTLTLVVEDPFARAPVDDVFATVEEASATRGRTTTKKAKPKAKPKPKRNTHRSSKAGKPAKTAGRAAPGIGGVKTVVRKRP